MYSIYISYFIQLYWLPESSTKIYSDEQDIYVVKKNGYIEIVGYLHGGYKLWLIDKTVIEFSNRLYNLAKEHKWDKLKFSIVTDFHLRCMHYSNIINLPIDTTYLFLESSHFGEAGDPKFQGLASEIQQSQFNPNRPKIKYDFNDDVDDEEAIMRSLRNGHGDSFGLG